MFKTFDNDGVRTLNCGNTYFFANEHNKRVLI